MRHPASEPPGRSFEQLLAHVRALTPQLPVRVAAALLTLLQFLVEERRLQLVAYVRLLNEWRKFSSEARRQDRPDPEELRRREESLVGDCAVLQGGHARLSALLVAFLSALPDPRSTLTKRQQHCLDLLQGKALTKVCLARKMKVERSYLHRNVLKPLLARGLIRNSREIGGYFRPDAPPTRKH